MTAEELRIYVMYMKHTKAQRDRTLIKQFSPLHLDVNWALNNLLKMSTGEIKSYHLERQCELRAKKLQRILGRLD